MSIEDFTEACKNGDIRLVTRLLTENLQLVNAPDLWGCVPLYYACRGGHLAVAQFLVEKGADVKHVYSGWSPFHSACKSGNLELVKWLLTIDPTLVDQLNKDGATLLASASLGGGVELVVWLFERGAVKDINKPDEFGRTPFDDGM
ncbi:MAG UNVERIFIED_CONTAM: ankyrin repeat domain-containing protein [Rickettsiaceae bacterium]|jgi:ankyrin repeat protein